jgi:hypothetical protein
MFTIVKRTLCICQRVASVPGFLSSRPNWVRPPPLCHKRGVLPPFGSTGAHSLQGEGMVGPNSDEGDRHCGTTLGIVKSFCGLFWPKSEPKRTEAVIVNLLRSPGIDSQTAGPAQQHYLSYRPTMLHRLAKSNPRNRFLVSLNISKYGLRPC